MTSIIAESRSRTRRRKSSGARRAVLLAHRAQLQAFREQEFHALLSHELLTPLTCILGWAQEANLQANPVLTRAALEIIQSNARRQKRLIDELLGLFRFHHGRLILDPEKIDLWNQLDPALIVPLANEMVSQLALDLNEAER